MDKMSQIQYWTEIQATPLKFPIMSIIHTEKFLSEKTRPPHMHPIRISTQPSFLYKDFLLQETVSDSWCMCCGLGPSLTGCLIKMPINKIETSCINITISLSYKTVELFCVVSPC